jgi:hypothetical protein
MRTARSATKASWARHTPLLLGLAAGLLCLSLAPAARAQKGSLSQLAGTAGCVSETGSGGACADGKSLVTAREVAVSKDGKHVYAASSASRAVAVFVRQKK